MPFIHMIFFNAITQAVDHTDSADTENYLLSKPIGLISAIKIRSQCPIIGSISINIRIKKKYRNIMSLSLLWHVSMPWPLHHVLRCSRWSGLASIPFNLPHSTGLAALIGSHQGQFFDKNILSQKAMWSLWQGFSCQHSSWEDLLRVFLILQNK